jgi:hypothetical protein
MVEGIDTSGFSCDAIEKSTPALETEKLPVLLRVTKTAQQNWKRKKENGERGALVKI